MICCWLCLELMTERKAFIKLDYQHSALMLHVIVALQVQIVVMHLTLRRKGAGFHLHFFENLHQTCTFDIKPRPSCFLRNLYSVQVHKEVN